MKTVRSSQGIFSLFPFFYPKNKKCTDTSVLMYYIYIRECYTSPKLSQGVLNTGEPWDLTLDILLF